MSEHVDYLRTLQNHYVNEANANFGTEAEYQYGGDALCVKEAADHLAEVEAKYATLLECVRLYADETRWSCSNNSNRHDCRDDAHHCYKEDFDTPGMLRHGYQPAQAALRKVCEK